MRSSRSLSFGENFAFVLMAFMTSSPKISTSLIMLLNSCRTSLRVSILATELKIVLGGTFELERRVKKLDIYGKLFSIGIFLLLAFSPGYAYDSISVTTADKPASMKLSKKLLRERKAIPEIKGNMTNESTSVTEKA